MKPLAALASLSTLCAVLSVSTNASADWSGGIEAGTQLRSGQSSPALRFYARHLGNPLSQYVYLDWIHDSGSSSYRLGYNPTYSVSQSIFSFGEFSIEQDDPGAIAREIDARIGVGNHLFRTNNSRFTVHTGIGGSKQEFDDPENDITEGYFFVGGLFTAKLIGLLRFDANVETTKGDTQTRTIGEAGISFRVGPNTALKYVRNFQHYNFDNLPDSTENDSFVTMTYNF